MDTSSPGSWAQQTHKLTLVTSDTKKEAGAAGGESGARSYGPALGGEAGSVLIANANSRVLLLATIGVVFSRSPRIRHRRPQQRQLNELQHGKRDLRRPIARLAYVLVTDFTW